jgi:SAM-dependent methyltransferase
MCNPACIEFGKTKLFEAEIKGKRVLEVGSLDINGSLRVFIKGFEPAEYYGVDIEDGPGVDIVCDIYDLLYCFGPESFDLVICTELIEHVYDWRNAVSKLKNVLRRDGILLLTTRSRGFGYHGYPFDFWRYGPEDMCQIFADLTIDVLERDPSMPGVFMKAHKPHNFYETYLDNHKLFSIIKNKRCTHVSDLSLLVFRMKHYLLHEVPYQMSRYWRKLTGGNKCKCEVCRKK